MKFFTLFFTLFLFSACSHKNAFSEFEMDKAQELSISSLKQIKITKGTKIVGIFNAVYLNEVYPKIYKGKEYFFVYIYLKEEQSLTSQYTKNSDILHITLNNFEAIKLEKLPYNNRFSNISTSQNKWNKYYLVSFAKQGSFLTLKLESDLFDSVALTYRKEQ